MSTFARSTAARPAATPARAVEAPSSGVPLPGTPLLKLYARKRCRTLAAEDAVEAQRRELAKLVRAAGRTSFGKDHDLAGIRNVASFQERVPLRTCGQLWDAYWKDAFPRLVDCTWPGTIPYYAVSSGTSTGGRPRVIVPTAGRVMTWGLALRAGAPPLVFSLAEMWQRTNLPARAWPAARQ
jgi:hypothetical protein